MNKILIVDDETDILELYKIRLEREGHTVLTAADGEEGLRIAREEAPDLIILDLMLPKIDGFKVCSILKSEEETRHIPVIILTARAEDKDKKTGMDVGADDYMTKPFRWEELYDKMLFFLGKKP